MAEHRRFADLDYGHAGLLTYIPSEDPENGPGLLHTARATESSAQDFRIVGSSAQLYPPSKQPLPAPSSSQPWQARRLQQRWLLGSHPEAFMGSACVEELLKEDAEHFRHSEGLTDRRPLLAIGLMTDLTNQWQVKSAPLLAVAAGQSGEQLRLVRLNESKWQWGDDTDATLNLSVVDSAHHEEETIWESGSVPLTQIKFASDGFRRGHERWLLVQKPTSTAIFQPEFKPVPELRGVGPEACSWPDDGRPSLISPNLLLTLDARQTGGNAHSDVALNPAAHGRAPQLVVIDECGYWSVWNVSGAWNLGKNTLRLVPLKCGHIAEGLLEYVPVAPAYPAKRHGVVRVGGSAAGKRDPKSPDFLDTGLGSSQLGLLWNTERVELVDYTSSAAFPKLELIPPAQTRPDQILDVQPSPVSGDHVFVLTTRQLIWMDLHFRDMHAEQPFKPAILLFCSHVGFGHDDMKMSVARADDDNDTTLVFTYSQHTEQLCVYWFSLSTAEALPQWHRHMTRLPGSEELAPRASVQLIQANYARLDVSPSESADGLGSRYAASGTKFYQVAILGDDLSVRYSICSSSSDPVLETTLPTRRVGWSRSELQRRWKMRRKHFLRHVTDTFVVPDGMSDQDLAGLLRREDVEGDEKEMREDSNVPRSREQRPVLLKLDRIAQFVRGHLDMAAAQGALGLPSTLFEAARGFLEHGLEHGLPLTTLEQVSWALEQPVAYEAPEKGMEEDVERLLDANDEKTIITQLGRHSRGEAAHFLLPYLQQRLSELWLGSASRALSEEVQQLRWAWVSEVARDMFLSNYGIMVQHVPLFSTANLDGGEATGGDETAASLPAQSPYGSPRMMPSSLMGASPKWGGPKPRTTSDGAVERLKLLATFLETGPSAAARQSRVLSYWPEERGVDTQDYVSSVAAATDEKFREARQRLRKMEARRKSQAERLPRPALSRQDLEGGAAGQDGARLPIRPTPHGHAMSSQQAAPESSQAQAALGAALTMSQPMAGAFGDRKRKKGRRKSGFR